MDMPQVRCLGITCGSMCSTEGQEVGTVNAIITKELQDVCWVIIHHCDHVQESVG